MVRSMLLEKLDQALNYPLTLISAPAGFGKTTLLSQWAAGTQSEVLPGQVAWVSLESECDLRRFWTYLITALDGVQTGIGESALALLDTPQPPINSVLRLLVNEIAATEDTFVLVLDDYDLANEPAIHSTLTFFVDHLPSNLHLLIASRSQPPLPLARWRARNQLYELREADLRLMPSEAAIFLNETRQLNLSGEDIAALETRTEGWIAGLQLVALSLHDADEAAKRSFVSEFTGSQRFILDYLVEEVLQQQPEPIKTFLLRTSVLDHLSAALCEAVTGQPEGQTILEYLERAHLFTIRLDQERRWYRYHHLFRDVLYHRLQQAEPDAVLELHRRAAEWHLEAGRTDDAIRHACAAQAWDQAASLIEAAIGPAWNRGEIRKIITWLGQLPGEHLDARIPLSLYYSRALLLGGQMEAAEHRLQQSENALRTRLIDSSTVEDRQQLGAIYAFRTTIAAVTGQTERARVLGREALSLLPAESIDVRGHALNCMGVNSYYAGEMVEAVQACAEAGEMARQAGNRYLMMAAASYQAMALVCRGQLLQAGQTLQRVLSLSHPASPPAQSRVPAAGVACATYGALLYEWNRLDEAERYLTEAIELGDQLALGSALWMAYHTLARLKLVQGDRASAEMMIVQAQRYRLMETVPVPERLMDAEQARANLALGQLEAADHWANTHQSNQPASPAFIQAVEGITRARLHLLRGQPEPALALLDQLRSTAEAGERTGHVIEILALTALAQQAQGDMGLAVGTLHIVLSMAEPEGYRRTFVDEGQPMAALLYQALARGILPDYVSGLLASFPTETAGSRSSPTGSAAERGNVAREVLIEPLSQRELEVLRMMAHGATNQEIARDLVIALTTAKKHVSNIIQKLAVDNRTQAVAKGRSLGLCE